MTYRERWEQLEYQILCPQATKSAESRGRRYEIKQCDLRTDFQRDRDRIIHCKSFRRLKHKTQVFLSPTGDHYRTRLTHTLEVAQVARTIARSLRLNEDLTEAIALGHDLGHTPFGHAGERALDRIMPGGFRHNEQSLRVVDELERLNLTYEVRNGILCHTGPRKADTLEGRIVHIADRIAYINHDIDDALRAGIITNDDLPHGAIEVLGATHGRRINNMILDVVAASEGKDDIVQSPTFENATNDMRRYMFDNIYSLKSAAKKEEIKAEQVIERLFEYYCKNLGTLPTELLALQGCTTQQIVCDHVSGMTDRFAVSEYLRLFVPAGWNG